MRRVQAAKLRFSQCAVAARKTWCLRHDTNAALTQTRMLTNAHLTAIILALAGIALASAPSRANCARSQLGTTCEWEEQLLVREWLARQRNGAMPYIAYHSGDNIGVDYNAGDILDETNRREAVALVEIYCKGKYRIIPGNPGHIDAMCVH
jgi:hypothetical protein